ncbi:MAG TPA: Ada metal-binding domain-containing protein, partial [Acidimicrobiales bacterium]|nr:Ada metal-binding domain-containing protein [Acidimicrobiales bacterium]
MVPEFDQCYRAVKSRDARFDGWFFTAVTSTGIYCRPSCPALTPKRSNVRFFATAAAAQLAGFRACKRCRPDATPGSPEWNGRADLVARAMRLIADGIVDREGVTGLAARLSYSERHLNRLLVAEVGAGPLALARAQRAHTARLLIETTDLGFAHVAFASGFASIRQFNDTIRAVFASNPTRLRQHHSRQHEPSGGVSLRLSFRQPLHRPGVLGFLAARAVPGVEDGGDSTYRRTLRLPHGGGVVA